MAKTPKSGISKTTESAKTSSSLRKNKMWNPLSKLSGLISVMVGSSMHAHFDRGAYSVTLKISIQLKEI